MEEEGRGGVVLTSGMGPPCTACACGLPVRPSPAPSKAVSIVDAGLFFGFARTAAER